MNDIFGEGGCLSSIHNNFEYRHEQLLMAEFVLETFYEHKNGFIEAGTGVGKTLAYLVPAIIYCLENNKVLAVSTETKALQKQLIDKDILITQNIINEQFQKDFKYSLCLGSSNYPCRRRFEALLIKGDFSKKEIEIIEDIKKQFENNLVFTRFDISISNTLWAEISRESDICSYYKCPFSSICIFQKAKKEWANSNLLVMNHHLFFSNIASGKTYLPKFDIVVFDEAHSIEGIASDQLGFDVSYIQMLEIMKKLYRKNKKSSIINWISDDDKREKAIKTITLINLELNSFFENLRETFLSDKITTRIRDPLDYGVDLLKSLKKLLQILEGVEKEIDEDYISFEFDYVRGRLFLFVQNLESIVYLYKENFVYWIERSEKELLGDIHLKGEPIDISETMNTEVNCFYETNLFVSATLTTKNDFSFIAGRLGLHDYRSLLLDSPFDYKNQVVLYLGKETALPDDPAYIDEAAKISNEIINHLGGNCLILFTSYRMLNMLRDKLEVLTDFNIYSQGDLPASEIMEHYIGDDGSILMGTHSFWQGIDLPGDLLRGVILMRLPFSVPDQPIIQAKIERLEQAGINSFSNFQLPNAIIRFKQGFGRLIRSSNDRGIVAVLDSRVTNKGYGKLFINSLPECKIVQDLNDLKITFTKLLSKAN